MCELVLKTTIVINKNLEGLTVRLSKYFINILPMGKILIKTHQLILLEAVITVLF